MVAGGENPHLNFSLGFFSQNRVYIFRVLNLRFEGEVRKNGLFTLKKMKHTRPAAAPETGVGARNL
jgi:hypothetical protein